MRHFVYMNWHKEVNAYSLENYKENEDYFIGYVSQKKRVITFRKDRIIKEFVNFDDAQHYAENLPEEIFTQFDQKLNAIKRIPSKPIQHSLTFCFTGFSKAQKQALIDLTIQVGLRAIQDVTSKCDYLVMCENSKTIGPSKRAKAESLGVKLIFENQFFHLIETGEIPQ
ncbi:BRCT domain-containing protein [Haemophilus haemolyticus]|uniref:BRCT domain-containing protein n=1 Tax=Haemophilus haemolyticus TaxID=726 RepID=UPI001FB8DCDC|nr:BRCT domain-containing protein [Haemophilus haemolyticus]